MNTITKGAILAIATAALGTTALLPAQAQPFGGGQREFTQHLEGGHARSFRPDMPRAMMGGGGGGLLDAFLSGGGAEAIDVAAVRLTHQLSLDDDQQALLEDLRLAALNAVAEVQAAREELTAVAEAEDETPDLVARYSGMVAMTTARADALAAMQPAFEAFVASLDDDQISALAPRHRVPSAPVPSAPDAEETPSAPAPQG